MKTIHTINGFSILVDAIDKVISIRINGAMVHLLLDRKQAVEFRAQLEECFDFAFHFQEKEKDK